MYIEQVCLNVKIYDLDGLGLETLLYENPVSWSFQNLALYGGREKRKHLTTSAPGIPTDCRVELWYCSVTFVLLHTLGFSFQLVLANAVSFPSPQLLYLLAYATIVTLYLRVHEKSASFIFCS